MTKIPVVTVENIYPKANGWNSVLLTKVITAQDGGSLLSFASRSGGSHKITVFENFKDEAIQAMGLRIGANINAMGLSFVYDLIETYTATLDKTDFDEHGNVTIEPMINTTTGEVQLYGGKPMFRVTRIVEAESVAELPKSQPKPIKTGYCEDVFDQEKYIVEEGTGKKRKTPEYQHYLNNLYAFYNVPSTQVPLAAQPNLAELAEASENVTFETSLINAN